jgi:hypothetical protein
MVLSWRIGPRDAETAFDLMTDLAQRVKGRIQMTTDGYRAYFNAVEDAFGTEIDFATRCTRSTRARATTKRAIAPRRS